ncbi:TPA: serine kinase [Candidatus Poribacteria bacterium]|nr:serine kinase [Candidatus Poribacteria bacterium]
MNVSDIVSELNLIPLSGPFEREIKGGYASDLISDVLANGEEGDVWVTIQIHRNVVSVASLKEFAAVIISGGRKPEESTIDEANREKVTLLSTTMSTYEVVGRLYSMGIR